jgi:hypothetical protein
MTTVGTEDKKRQYTYELSRNRTDRLDLNLRNYRSGLVDIGNSSF